MDFYLKPENDRLPRLERVLVIDAAIGSGSYPNLETLAEECGKTTKTIQRDIEYMKCMLNAPIVYDYTNKGYAYSENTFSIPSGFITESDLFAIFIASKLIDQYGTTPLGARLYASLERIVKALPSGKVSLNTRDMTNPYSFTLPPVLKQESKVWDVLGRALEEQRTIRILHRSSWWQKTTERRVDPYHLHNYAGEWYLTGFCHLRGEYRDFAVGRIKSAKLLRRKFEMPADFDKARFLRGALGRLEPGRGSHEIRLKFSSIVAERVSERVWHPTQEMARFPDGAVEMRFKCEFFGEVRSWILSWGDMVEVLDPPELRGEIAGILTDALKNYAPGAAPL